MKVSDNDKIKIKQAMLGTTQCTNAVVKPIATVEETAIIGGGRI